MATLRIALGDTARLTPLFSYPNDPSANESLADTILHWFRQTLKNDGENIVASMDVKGDDYTLVLDARDPNSPALSTYARRLPQFLVNGDDALKTVAEVKAAGKWDPSPNAPPPPYRPWRFFLPLGMAMANQKSLQFFHYPPIRLLEQTRDYLVDPVPARVFELLEANGVAPGDVALYNTVVDGAPIAAEDNQGSKQGGDPKFGWIPIQDFGAYQKAQVALLLNPHPSHPGFTVPIVVYGAHPREVFQQLYKGVDLGKGDNFVFTPKASWAEIIPGKRTPVVGANHPYNFYAEAQGFATVGSGKMLSQARCRNATELMRGDLAITRWQKMMADDPTQTPADVLAACMSYWHDAEQAATVCMLVKHQASLTYTDPTSLAFEFAMTTGEAASACSASDDNACAGVPT